MKEQSQHSMPQQAKSRMFPSVCPRCQSSLASLVYVANQGATCIAILACPVFTCDFATSFNVIETLKEATR